MTHSLDGVVLAAGLSTRAEQFKMAMMLGDKTLIEHSVASMYEVVDRIIVVGGHGIERIREILKGYSKVEVVYNQQFQQGMFSSVREGVKHVTGHAFFLLPGDYPLVSEDTYRQMLKVSADVVIPTCNGRKGHPVLMSARLIENILRAPETFTLRDCIEKAGYITVEVEDEGILRDVDNLEDYENVKRVYENED